MLAKLQSFFFKEGETFGRTHETQTIKCFTLNHNEAKQKKKEKKKKFFEQGDSERKNRSKDKR